MPVEPGEEDRQRSASESGPAERPARPVPVSTALIDAARVADALSQGFAVIDAQGRLLLINRSVRRHLGLAPRPTFADVLARCFRDEAHRDRARAMLTGVARDAVPVSLEVVIESDESPRRLLLQAAVCRPPDSREALVAISLVDGGPSLVGSTNGPTRDGAVDGLNGDLRELDTRLKRYREFFDARVVQRALFDQAQRLRDGRRSAVPRRSPRRRLRQTP